MRIWILMRARNETIMVRMSVCYEVRGEWIRMQGQVSGGVGRLRPGNSDSDDHRVLVKPARKRSGGGAGGGRLMGYTPKLVDMVRSATGPPLE